MSVPTIIIRHARENLKKCSLRGLESLSGFSFFTYPDCVLGKKVLPSLKDYRLLAIDGSPLTENDCEKGIILIDSTWRLLDKIMRCTPELQEVERRSIPQGFITAYPRKQEDCPNPDAGLASIEALYIAYFLMGRDTSWLLKGYYWKEKFLNNNKLLFTSSL